MTAARIRPATVADAAAIGRLKSRNNIGDPDPVAWRSQWETYPFADEFRGIVIGWVLETDLGDVVGNLNNVHMLYELGGRRLKGAIASDWMVDQEYRGQALQLMTTFLRQEGIDLMLVVSANATTAQVMTAMKIARIPIPDYATPCFWAVRRRAFAKAALLRKSIPGARLWAWPAGLALLARDIYCGSGSGRALSPVRRLKDFDDRFARLATAAAPLRAVRNKAVLAWRFQTALREGRAVIVAAERGEELLGYAVVVRRETSELCDVADIQAAADDPATIRDLLLGAIKVAREEGADALKFMSGMPVKRGAADGLRPYSYRLPFWQLYYRAASPELYAALSTSDAWDFSLFDTY